MSTNRSNEELEALAQRLRRLPEPPVPENLESRLLAAIPGRIPPTTRSRHRLWRVQAGALVAAAVVLAFLLGYRLGRA